MRKARKKYILYIGSTKKWEHIIHEYAEQKNLPWKILSLVPANLGADIPASDITEYRYVDFNNDQQLEALIENLKPNLAAVINRSEKYIPYFRKLIPLLPEDLFVPTPEALLKATEKTAMRKAFWKYDKTITPKFEIIEEVNDATLGKITKRLEFPMIVKPAGLAQAVLVQQAHYPEELVSALKNISQKIDSVYKDMKGRGKPQILVEEIIEGDQYSIEAFVDDIGNVAFCPFVKYKTSLEKGFDDFFSYEQTLPATISRDSASKAKQVAIKGIHALGLRNSSAHIELIRREGDWFIVEIAPRLGGFRSLMYRKSYGINIDVLDVENHLGKKISVPRKKQGYTSVIKFFAQKEGIIKKITGSRKIQNLESYESHVQRLKKGDRARFAKNGGKDVFRVTLFNTNKSQFIADKRKLEKMIYIETVSSKKKLNSKV
jgi:biotin carboxylase